MKYIGSVNKKTLEVKLGEIIENLDWLAIPEGTTDITNNDLTNTVYFWDTINSLTIDLGEWEEYGDGTGMVTFQHYCESNVDSVKVVSIANLVRDLTLNVNNSEDVKPPNAGGGDMFNPLSVQAGGGHYRDRGIQPIEYINANNLDFQQGNVVKYITRFKDKNGIKDLEKVIHYTLLEAFFIYGESGSTELKNLILKMLGEEK